MASIGTITLLLYIFAGNCQLYCAGPGTYYYRKPSLLMFYKSGPPVYVYPYKQEKFYPSSHDIKAIIYPDIFYKKLPKYVKYKLVGKLKSSLNIDDHIQFSKNYGGNGWFIDNEKKHIKFSEPVFSPEYYYTSNNQLYKHPQHHSQSGLQPSADVKPVEEHIEDDLKYDFRTKTHSYD